MKISIEIVFFDLDGTLADTDGDIRLAGKAAMADMKLECPRFDELFVAGPTIETMAKMLFGDAYTDALGAELRRRFGTPTVFPSSRQAFDDLPIS